MELVLGTKTIYNLLKKHKLNVLSVKLKRKYKRFEMKHPNELVQMDTKEPFYLKASRTKHYFIHVIDDCSRKVVSKWCNRRTSEGHCQFSKNGLNSMVNQTK